MTSVLVVGAGPTGLTLALQAHDHGATVRIVDRRRDVFRPSRALIVHPRTLEVLRPLGVTGHLLERADTSPEIRLHLGSREVDACLDHLDLPDTAFPHVTLVRQMDIEAILIDALLARGIEVERGIDVIEVESHRDRASATLRTLHGQERVSCDAIAGCDGPDSIVRRSASIAWHGKPYREEIILADAELDGLPTGRAHAFIDRRGLLLAFPLGERAAWRLLATRAAVGPLSHCDQPGAPVPMEDLRTMLAETGVETGITELAWSARYRVQRRVAGCFQAGRLFIAGDAAHSFSPATGQGLNTGIQDAINLGWKLAYADSASDRDTLLASYGLERRSVVRRTIGITHLAFLLEASTAPLPSLVRHLAPIAAPLIPIILRRRRLVAEGVRLISQLRASYPHSPLSIDEALRHRGTPRAGHRLPDAPVVANGRRVRLHELTAGPGVHVLVHGDARLPADIDLSPRVTVHRLDSESGTDIIGVRPDGYIGFRGSGGDGSGLRKWLDLVGATPLAITTRQA